MGRKMDDTNPRGNYVPLTSTNTADTVIVSSVGSTRRGNSPRKNARIEAAVYAYLRARRALGVTSLNSVEIARALNLTNDVVEAAVATLRNKGVKLVA